MSDELLELARRVVREAKAAGADEVSAGVSRSVHTSLTRRDNKVEQATEAISRGLSFSVLVDDKFSSHGTSDLRPEALSNFIKQAIEATKFLEPDPDRRQPDVSLCGRGVSDEQLDQLDPSYEARTADERAEEAEQLENDILANKIDGAISSAAHMGDGFSQSARVMSNGFEGENKGAWFMMGAETTFQDGEKRPEASSYYGARHLSDLPTREQIAQDVRERALSRVGSGPIDSGTYPMILLNRSVGRILGVISGPLSGGSLHQHRSCLEGKLGEAIGSSCLTLHDDPTIPRGLSSRPWDGDALVAKPRTIIENGILKQYYINVYYGRKLGKDPTTGGSSNWVVPPGERSWQDIARQFPKAILVDGFLGGNCNGTSGDFSFGVRGTLLENGEPTKALSEMNVAGNILEIFHKLTEVANDPYMYSSLRSPSLLFEDVQFSGT